VIVLHVWLEGILAVFRSLFWILTVVGTVSLLVRSGNKRTLPAPWRKLAVELHLALSLVPPIGYLLSFYLFTYLQWLKDFIYIKPEPFVGWSLITWLGLHLRLRSETSAAYKAGLTVLLFLTWYLVVNVFGAHSIE
jgi:hypothetical protein